jgi:hypothetical protein
MHVCAEQHKCVRVCSCLYMHAYYMSAHIHTSVVSETSICMHKVYVCVCVCVLCGCLQTNLHTLCKYVYV